jgi:hypothetical protein
MSRPVGSGFCRPMTRKRVVVFGSSSTFEASVPSAYSSAAAAPAMAAP